MYNETCKYSVSDVMLLTCVRVNRKMYLMINFDFQQEQEFGNIVVEAA